MEDELDFGNDAPYWRCEHCGNEDHTTPMPKDRDAFYKKPKPRKCKKCKSNEMMPVGF